MFNGKSNEEADPFAGSKAKAQRMEAEEKQSKIREGLPLQREIPASEPFPFEALGVILGTAAFRVFEVVKAADSVCGSSFLAAASLCVQAHRNIYLDGRIYPLSEYFLTVAISGDRKSSVDKLALRAVRVYEKSVLKTEFDTQMIQYRNEQDAWSARRKQFLRVCPDTLDDDLKNLIEPKRPLDPIISCEEPTIEGLQKLFHSGRPSLGLFTDEGARFFGGFSMNQENLSKTIACLSKLWDADGPITRIRCEERMQLYGRRLAAHLMIQPTIFRNLVANQIFRDQGILARFLTVCPLQTGGTPKYEKIDLSRDPYLQEFWTRCSDTLDAKFPLVEGNQNELDPQLLKLSEEAEKTWIQFYQEIESELGISGRYRIIYPFARKIAEHAARIAGILEVFDNLQALEISSETMRRAIEIARWYLNEAMRMVGVVEVDEELDLAQKVLEFLLRQRDKIFPIRIVYKDGPNPVRTKKKADRIMEILAQHGYVNRLDGKKDWWELAATATCNK